MSLIYLIEIISISEIFLEYNGRTHVLIKLGIIDFMLLKRIKYSKITGKVWLQYNWGHAFQVRAGISKASLVEIL